MTDKIRLIGSDGSQIGIVTKGEARRKAEQENLDLVPVSPKANPPVFRIMDKGKLEYEKKKKKKKQKVQDLKEIKVSARIGEGDFQRKVKEARKFLEKRMKVKVSLMFKGREISHREIGQDVVNRLIDEVDDVGVVDTAPFMNGRQIVATLSPR